MVRRGSEESIHYASRMDLLQWYHPILEGSGEDPKLGSHVAEFQSSCLHQKRSQYLSAPLCFLVCKYIFLSTDRMLLTVLFPTLSKCGHFMIDYSDHLYLPKSRRNCCRPLLLRFIVYKCFSSSQSSLKKKISLQ